MTVMDWVWLGAAGLGAGGAMTLAIMAFPIHARRGGAAVVLVAICALSAGLSIGKLSEPLSFDPLTTRDALLMALASVQGLYVLMTLWVLCGRSGLPMLITLHALVDIAEAVLGVGAHPERWPAFAVGFQLAFGVGLGAMLNALKKR